jgi:arylsulfatase A-like enzyme
MRRYHPFLSRARAHAISFRRFTSPVPESRAAFASLFCSKFPLPTEFGGDVEETLDLGRCLALPRVLAAHGVRTGFFSSSPFRDWIAQSFYERLGFEDLKDAGRLVTDHVAGERAVHVRDGRVMERDTVGALLQWTDRRCEAREPFFAVYYSWVAHAPYPASYPEGFPVSPDAPASMRYRRLVRVLDRQIERLYAVTLRDDCGRDTVLLVTGDHGEAFEEHPGNVFHGAYLWEENVHVPLLVLHPGLERVVSDRGASHVDIAPTIVDLMLSDLALAPEVSFYEGRSLFQAAQPWPVFSATLHGQGYVSSRFEQFKLIQGSSSVRLFDTDADPGERVDLSARHPELTTALRHALAGWAAHEHAITAVAAVGSPGRGARDAVPCR